jgi:hypothetical protein
MFINVPLCTVNVKREVGRAHTRMNAEIRGICSALSADRNEGSTPK